MLNRFAADPENELAEQEFGRQGVWHQFLSIARNLAAIVDALTPMIDSAEHAVADEIRLVLQGRAFSSILCEVLRGLGAEPEASDDEEGVGPLRLLKEVETYWSWIDEDGRLSGDYDEESLEALAVTLRELESWFDGLPRDRRIAVDREATATAIRIVPSCGELPELYRLLVQLPEDAQAALEFALPHAPLLDILFLVQNFTGRADEAGGAEAKAALFRIADYVIARHPEPQAIAEQLTAFVDGASQDFEAWLVGLASIDRPLAMQLLNHIAAKSGAANLDRISRAFALASAIARNAGDPHAEAIVFHQQGNALADLRDYAAAEHAFARADSLLATTGSRFRVANALARADAIVGLIVAKAPLPSRHEIDAMLAIHAAVAESLVPMLATAALDREDLVEAEDYLSRVRRSGTDWHEENPAAALAEARLARLRGNSESADRILSAIRPLAAKHPGLRDELDRQLFFYERDMNPTSSANEALLGQARTTSDADWGRYQQGLLHLRRGEREEANGLFRLVLATAEGGQRADCLGMIAMTSDDPLEGLRLVHEAIGLFCLAGRKIDHATALSNLATIHIGLGLYNVSAGMPAAIDTGLAIAAALLESAEQVAGSAGAVALSKSMRLDRARLAAMRDARIEALQHYAEAFAWLETEYIAFAANDRAQQYLGRYLRAYDEAVTCALDAGRPDIALAISDRSKALRLTRGFSGEESGMSGDRQLWQRVLQGYGLAPEEREQLNPRPQPGAGAVSGQWPYSAHLATAYRALFPATSPPDNLASIGDVEAAPVHGGFACPECKVFNQVESSYCSACEQRLPKSAIFFLEFDSQNPRLRGDHYYNLGVACIPRGEFADAETLFVQALEECFHPDYAFFLGYCRLTRGAIEEARESFTAAADRQFANTMPFWPLAISPAMFRDAVAQLGAGSAHALRAFVAGLNEHRLGVK